MSIQFTREWVSFAEPLSGSPSQQQSVPCISGGGQKHWRRVLNSIGCFPHSCNSCSKEGGRGSRNKAHILLLLLAACGIVQNQRNPHIFGDVRTLAHTGLVRFGIRQDCFHPHPKTTAYCQPLRALCHLHRLLAAPPSNAPAEFTSSECSCCIRGFDC